ncbi:MAG: hypothetical protein ACKOPM_13105, partial [Novosphingobium sp.]
ALRQYPHGNSAQREAILYEDGRPDCPVDPNLKPPSSRRVASKRNGPFGLASCRADYPRARRFNL